MKTLEKDFVEPPLHPLPAGRFPLNWRDAKDNRTLSIRVRSPT
ncbi:MAG TPA: hypothetical protein VK639_01730 [Terriglobales bacterium]|jgi:hypothetical protein|nr:hypothetical protein [Terriglobales bacterium]